MRTRLLTSIGALGVVGSPLVLSSPTQITAQAGAGQISTPWGEPDLQGIWTVVSDTPLQRPAKYAWTVKQEFSRQSEQENRSYYEPRCQEGNYGLPGLLRGRRAEDLPFREGNHGQLTRCGVP